MKYANRYLPKQATSSFFPKNWDITRVKEEVALVYEQMIKSGKFGLTCFFRGKFYFWAINITTN
jgi:hypothetical protein